ncbi:MAG: UDP-N-acetylglucosamine--N-acetylmuramyl-(pentapeptide) pyrophosphoryl-undecaprenol N-acetylglucosamine transferase [Halobacteriovoraceae bacterium]|nr:UDP-N-acetylglucosamine--N-acetylmuramyl-(pentapeptide) pyrophosphoryl-undecaprenol N-acetylglucosamine transferase [Halobacteriovoraceae bacterium]|tara:strand:+ start:59052 stop:60107 length:1056 start_codon:yes stop_codon:yes gene_type:complete
MNRIVAIAAGGTGGHINAALSMGEQFKKNGYRPIYFTGTRYLDFQLFKECSETVHHLKSRPLRSKNPFRILINIGINLGVFIGVLLQMLKKRPMCVLGAGGYVCGPTMVAAKILGIKCYIIEQNAVAGLTNKLLAKISSLIFVNFENTKGISKTSRVIVSGNPVRSSIKHTPNEVGDVVNILVFGGSLGAKQLNDAFISLIQKQWNINLNIIHQVGRNNLKEVSPTANVTYDQKEYLDNMDELYSWANIIVSRAGASTISELRVAKRPSILVPYPFATDDHQTHNALELKNEECFYVKVIDNKQVIEGIESDIKNTIEEIVEKNLFSQFKECANVDASKLIYEKVINNVRN